jgi:lipoprotein-anchoring transpeptidase ErfK/SrfK
MNRGAGTEEALSRSFACLGFVAAALIVMVQWLEAPGNSGVAMSNSSTLGNEFKNGWSRDQDNSIESALATPEAKLIVDLSDRRVYFYERDALIVSYEIAVGRSGWETPTGEFKVVNMKTDPVWQHPFTKEIVPAGSGNPLGSRWIGFWSDGEQQIGFHGTNEEDLIGQAVSHGCIRLREADIQALFELVSLDMPVLIRP